MSSVAVRSATAACDLSQGQRAVDQWINWIPAFSAIRYGKFTSHFRADVAAVPIATCCFGAPEASNPTFSVQIPSSSEPRGKWCVGVSRPGPLPR